MAATTVACSLVASLGDDFETVPDASSGPTDAGAGEDATPPDAPVTSLDAGSTCAPGLDPTFANGPVAALAASADGGRTTFNGLMLANDGTIVAAQTLVVGNGPSLEVARFAADGGFLGADPVTPGLQAEPISLAGNGTFLGAVMFGLVNNMPLRYGLFTDAQGNATVLLPSNVLARAVALDAQHLVLGVVDSAGTNFGVRRMFLDGGEDLAFGAGGTVLEPLANALDGGPVCPFGIGVLGGGDVLEVATTCTLVGQQVVPDTPTPVLALGAEGQVVAMHDLLRPVDPAVQVTSVVPMPGDAGAYLLAVGSDLVTSAEVLLVDPSGTPVPSFNDGGWLVAPVAVRFPSLIGDGQGRAWIVGSASLDGGAEATVALVARVLADGGLDPSWSDGGYATFASDAGPITAIGGLTVTSDGRLVVAAAIDAGNVYGATPALLRICP